jgi:HTH-type transcriptional regulator / antitoxin HipB
MLPYGQIDMAKDQGTTRKLPYGIIDEPAAIGRAIRHKRRELGVTQAEVAGLAGVGVRFLSELENGKPTAELGKVLRVLGRLGIELWVLPRGETP